LIANQLINYAWVLAGIVARDLDEVSGSQGADGLFWLNQILAEKSITARYIPFYTHYTFPTVVGQEIYFVPNIVELETLTFNIDVVRFEMRLDNRRHYFGAPRVDNIESLPYHYYFERVLGGGNIYLYFIPNKIYTMKAVGRFALTQVAATDDLSTQLDAFYQSYLMYELANRLCDWYKISLPPATEKQLIAFRDQFEDLNPMDLTIKTTSTLTKNGGFNWGQVNIGRGWTTP
jgi:hypothetical protein